jgi:putative ABC transport system permease protein
LIVTHRTATHNRFSYPDFEKLRANFDVIDSLAVWGVSDFDVDTGNGKTRAHTAFVSDAFFRVLGLQPALGRLLQDGDDSSSAAATAVLGYGFWQRAYAGNASVIGGTLRIGGHPFTIVGVMPKGFGGTEVSEPRDVILPIRAIAAINPDNAAVITSSGAYWLKTVLRLKPGITMDAARPILRDQWPRVMLGGATPSPGAFQQKLDIQPGGRGLSRIRDEFSQALIVLMVLVALVLLIACANIANLLLARAAARRKEMAVRLAIGANRGRLVRQALTESLLLAACGGVAGVALAAWISRGLLLFLPAGESGFLAFEPNVRRLMFTGFATVATALIFGLLPAFQSTGVPLSAAMNAGARGAGGVRRTWASRAVVSAQVAVCLVLVAGALLFARSLNNVANISLGIQQEGLYLVGANTSNLRLTKDRADAFVQDAVVGLAALPDVVAVSAQRSLPLSGGAWWNSPKVPGFVPTPGEPNVVYMNAVSPGYFKTMGTRLLAGREFSDRDTKGSPFVAVVNQAFARRYYGTGPKAIGQRFALNDDAGPDDLNLEIVGVVENTKYLDPRETSKELVYFALYQSRGSMSGSYAVRVASGANAQAMAGEIRTALGELLPGVSVDVQPYRTLLDAMTRRDRMVAVLSGAFGVLGLVLACIGLYGLMSQAVAARSGEIGIRITLGARRSQVEWLVLREALSLVVIGLAIGVPVAVASASLARGLLYGLTASDPVVAAGAVLMMFAVTAGAAWIPARRASHIDPMRALRHE